MKRRKVLFLIESLSGGGAEKVLSTLVKNLDREKFDVTVCSIINCGAFIDDVKSNVKYYYILPDPYYLKCRLSKFWFKVRYKLIYSWLSSKLTYKIFVPKGNDVEVAFVEGTSTRIISGSTSKRAKKIAWIHIDMVSNDYSLEAFSRKKERMKRAYEKFDSIVGVSDVAASSLNGLLNSNFSTDVLYNPIASNEIVLKSRDNKDIPEKKDGVVRICSIGRLVDQKAFHRLVQIASKLKNDGRSFEIWILGIGIKYYELKKQIENLSLSNEVKLMGFQKNPYAFLSKVDVFVCSSIAEGYSTAVSEALILGIPVITTDCSGMKELLGENNEYGIVTKNTEDDLYEAVSKVFDDKFLAELKQKAKRRSSYFKLDSLMRPIEMLLNS